MKTQTFNAPRHNPTLPPPLVRAISLWQPWAMLMALGAKKYETRDWSTTARGIMGIHAAKAVPSAYRDSVEKYFRSNQVQDVLTAAGLNYSRVADMPNGFVAVGRLTGCHRSSDLLRLSIETERGRDELYFGDYTEGRWVHEYETILRLPEVVPCRGYQQFWDVPDLALDAIARQFVGRFDKVHAEYRRAFEWRTADR